jgi:hypothetical protein
MAPGEWVPQRGSYMIHTTPGSDGDAHISEEQDSETRDEP